MPNWLRRRRQSTGPVQPTLRTDDRSAFRETRGSRELASQMLETATRRADQLSSGTRFEVEIPGGFSHVHNMELMLTLTQRAPERGLMVEFQFNNTITFRKL